MEVEEVEPRFIIVGAPKSGTTSLVWWLQQHPEVFMPSRELHFFGEDLGIVHQRNQTLEAYLKNFRECDPKEIPGEKSVWYLWSRSAAGEIHDFNSGMRILILLREPVSLMYSLHGHGLYWGVESYREFQDALDAEPRRKEAFRKGGPNSDQLIGLLYREVARLNEQVGRYFAVFPREQIKVILLDDLKEKPNHTYQEVLRFLNVSPDFHPDYSPVNQNRVIRNLWLQRYLRHPPKVVKRLAKASMPLRARQAIANRLQRINLAQTSRGSLDPELRASLKAEFHDEVLALSDLIERDLSKWL